MEHLFPAWVKLCSQESNVNFLHYTRAASYRIFLHKRYYLRYMVIECTRTNLEQILVCIITFVGWSRWSKRATKLMYRYGAKLFTWVRTNTFGPVFANLARNRSISDVFVFKLLSRRSGQLAIVLGSMSFGAMNFCPPIFVHFLWQTQWDT